MWFILLCAIEFVQPGDIVLGDKEVQVDVNIKATKAVTVKINLNQCRRVCHRRRCCR